MSKQTVTMDPTIGEIAYNAYSEALGFKTENDEELQPFKHQSARDQDAWEAAAEAVAEYLEKND